MKVDELIPLPSEKILFALSSFKLVPQDFGCYIMTTFNNHILYIGFSDNLNRRFKQHLENPEKTKPTEEGKVLWFYFKTYNPKNLEQLERTWLNQFVTQHGRRPLLNKLDSPIS
jgi:excinuclease UvrABC nuclease subunit